MQFLGFLIFFFFKGFQACSVFSEVGELVLHSCAHRPSILVTLQWWRLCNPGACPPVQGCDVPERSQFWLSAILPFWLGKHVFGTFETLHSDSH